MVQPCLPQGSDIFLREHDVEQADLGGYVVLGIRRDPMQHPFGHFVKGLVQMGRGRPVPVRGLSSYTHVPDRTRVLMVRMTHGVGIARRAVSDVCRVALLLQPSCLHLMLILLHNLKPAPHMSHERHPISKANERCASSSLVCSGRSKMD